MSTTNENTFADRTQLAGMLDPVTRRGLDRFRKRRGFLLTVRGLGVGLLTFVMLALFVAIVDYLMFLSDAVRWSLGACVYVVTAIVIWLVAIRPLRHHDDLEIARQIESVAPHLRESLVSAVELSDPKLANGSPYFRHLLQNRVARRITKVDVGKVLPLKMVRRWLLSGLSVVLVCCLMALVPSAQFGRRFARAALPGFSIERAARTKISIVQPDPASKYVAQGDAVAVAAAIAKRDDSEVVMQWRDGEGNSGEAMMTPRFESAVMAAANRPEISDPASDSTRGPDQEIFAANLSVGSKPLEYRLLAGDAITNWHRLTPLPRPKVTMFEKLYRLPEYAKLNDRTEEEEHGDLKALQGSTAEVTVSFDQPVESVAVRYGVRGSQALLEPVNEERTKYRTSISIKTSGQYQIEAVSTVSGLGNPFAPMNMIVPVLDLAPIVRWAPGTELKRLVSSLDVIELEATIADDLPIESIEQEVTVNGQEPQSYPLPTDGPARQHELAWSWDLLHRLGETVSEEKLQAGDVVQTRIVAIDRKGNRSASPMMELLIAGDGFDSDRHAFLENVASEHQAIASWAEQCQAMSEQMREAVKSDEIELFLSQWTAGAKTNDDPETAKTTPWAELQRQSVVLVKSLRDSLAMTSNEASAMVTELAGNVILDIETLIDHTRRELAYLDQHREPDWERARKQHLTEMGRAAGHAKNQSQRLSEFARYRFAVAFLSAMYSDVTLLKTNIETLADQLPEERLNRHLTLIAGQFKEVDRLLREYESILPTRTVQHLAADRWDRWSQRWTIQLETLVEEEADRDQIAAVLDSLKKEVVQKPHEIFDHGIYENLVRLERDLVRELGYLCPQVDQLRDRGRKMNRALSDQQQEKNAEKAKIASIESRWNQIRFANQFQRLIVRSTGRENLGRAKTRVDLEFMSDLNLFVRAIRNVTQNGFQPYKEIAAEQVINEISGAVRVLESASELRHSAKVYLAMRDGEQQVDGSPLRKIYHPIWLKLVDVRLDLAAVYLRDAALTDATIHSGIEGVRRGERQQSAAEKFGARVWRDEPMVSAAVPLETLAKDVSRLEDRFESEQTTARETLQKYVLSLAEQARLAAEQAGKAETVTDARASDELEEVQDALDEIELANEKATDTVQSLIDAANTSTVLDQEQRERARDADAAAEMIADALQETKLSARQADRAATDLQRQRALEKTEENLANLKRQLSNAADHFEKIERGEDVRQSRQALRDAEQQLRISDQIQQRYEQVEKMADVASQDPRELLKKLEDELADNQAMRDSLSEIAESIVDDTVDNLRRAANEERQLGRSIEQDDDAFRERKHQQQMLLDEFIDRAETLRDRTLPAAVSAAGWANDGEGRHLLGQAIETLNEAIKATEKRRQGEATLDEIRDAARLLRDQMAEAQSFTNEAAEQLERSSDRDLHQSENARNRTAQNMRQHENRLRNQELNALNEQRNRWNTNETQANQRINRAQQEIRAATEVIERESERLKESPGDQWRRSEIEQQEDRLDEARRTETQAKATKQLARQRRDKANERANEINRNKVAELTKLNPAAELGQKLGELASSRFDAISDDLEEMVADADFDESLRASNLKLAQSVEQQESISHDLQQAVEDLRRAGRHERRLEKTSTADRLEQAAELTESQALGAAHKSRSDFAAAEQDAEKTPQASVSTERAGKAIDQTADALNEMFPSANADASDVDQSSSRSSESASQSQMTADATQDPSQSATNSQSPTNANPTASNSNEAQSASAIDQATPEQMARTLDELDRSLAQSASEPQGEGNQGSANTGQENAGQVTQAGSTQANSTQGQPGSQASQSQPGSASEMNGTPPPSNQSVDASPTLAQMLDDQLQQAAKERMRRLAETQSGQRGESTESSSNASSVASDSGSGEPPGGSDEVNEANGKLTGGDWGDLRMQGVEDANQGRATRIPRGYSAEVKAYFKALGKRSAGAKQ
ncbi:hypothetical protein U8335_27690 [Roseiconus lacunae]|uniref:hypothetical protein n=1 Tax=Roseiconus lacunae TaxID=2605694 RepID=UPI0030936E47|nr:hypothetical protein U8335_27690 [Stieleria sp. HD01]